MIFESEDEKQAFEYMYELASDCTSRRGCNDLEKEYVERFKHLKVKSTDVDNTEFMREISYDFDVAEWLKSQAKMKQIPTIISTGQLSTICIWFHKWFRMADCKNNADIDMYKAIKKLDEKEYARAMQDSLKEAGIEVD